MRYLGAIDQGTTSTRFIIFDERGEIVSSAQIEHRQVFPQPGWVEHDAEEIWANVMKVVHSALAKASMDASALSGIGITNQRETVVAFNPKTGRVYHNAIVWQDLRTSGIVTRLRSRMDEGELTQRTGLRFSEYFSASKIVWLLENVRGLRQAMERGEVVFGTMDCWNCAA